MRLRTLSLQAFGPFPGEHTIDFAALDGAGVYLISGPTGAGKSSILDAVVFALYGSIPREATATGAPFTVRSDLANAETETRVTLEFVTADTAFRIDRSPAYERPKRRGEGTTRATVKATLAACRDGEWQLEANGANEVGVRVQQIVGLSRDQFQQIIVLAQGRFAEFLHADSNDREAILRKLFDSTRFQHLTDRLHEQAGESRQKLADIARGIDEAVARAKSRTDEADLTPEITAAEDDLLAKLYESVAASLARANASYAQAESVYTATTDRLQLAKQVDADVRQRDAASTAMAVLETRASQIDDDRNLLRLHRLADDIRPELAAVDRSMEVLEEAATALSVFGELPDAAQMQTELEGLHERVAVLKSHLGTEQDLPDLREQAATADAAVADAVRRRDIASDRAASIPAKRRTLTAEIADLTSEVERLPAALVNRDKLQTARALVDRRDTASANLNALVAAENAAKADLQQASDRVRELLQRFYETTSARLACELVAGEPCSVCGSIDHPSPASGDAGHVVESAAIEAAQQHEAIARQRSEEASAAALQQRVQLESIDNDLEGIDRDCLDDEIAQAAEAVRGLEADAERLQASKDALRELDAELEEIGQESDTLAAAVEEAKSLRAAASERVIAAETSLARLLGDDGDTVTGRLAEAEQETAVLRKKLDASLAHDRAVQRLSSDRAALETAMTDHEAHDEATARSWLLSRQRRDELQAGVDAFTAERERLTGVLRQSRFTDLDARIAAEGGELDELEATVAEAKVAERTAGEVVAWHQSLLGEIDREQKNVAALTTQRAELGDRAAALSRLAATLSGHDPNTRRMRLETYVLASQLEAILEAANVRLASLTDHRFTLQHFDGRASRGAFSGLGIVVADAHSGTTRSVASLSGGETFLASLALALGLADVVQAAAGGIALETLFIDEGFGSLDQETLESAMQALSDLHASGRTIGVISHVTSMQERLPQLINVRPLPGGEGSGITVETPG